MENPGFESGDASAATTDGDDTDSTTDAFTTDEPTTDEATTDERPGDGDGDPAGDGDGEPEDCGESSLCAGECVDTEIDLMHCGDCGNPCGPGEFCEGGDCYGPEDARIVFVTSEWYSASDLGGLAGADERCQDAAILGGLEGVYWAWLGTENDSPLSNFDLEVGPYILPSEDIVVVAFDWADLTDGNLQHPIDQDESGVFADPPPAPCNSDFGAVWTAVKTDGSTAAGANCVDWTAQEFDGAIGFVGSMSGKWTASQCELQCFLKAPIYCVEQ